MVDTDKLNKRIKQITLERVKACFSELPIIVTKISDSPDDAIVKYKIVETIKKKRFLFFTFSKKIEIKTIQDISYRVEFIFKDEKKFIFINNEMLNNKEDLIRLMKYDLGLK
jgi:hypothetical protein